MDELRNKRINRALEGLSDEHANKVLDYVEFLLSKYGARSAQPSTLEKIADGVEDTLRVTKMPIAAIKGTRDVLDTAGRMMRGLADAGKSMVDELQEQLAPRPNASTPTEPTAAADEAEPVKGNETVAAPSTGESTDDS